MLKISSRDKYILIKEGYFLDSICREIERRDLWHLEMGLPLRGKKYLSITIFCYFLICWKIIWFFKYLLLNFFFWKLGIRSKDWLIRGDQFHRLLQGPRSKPEQSSVWTCPPKLALEGIEPETLREAYSKIPSQPLGQPQMGLLNFL